MSLFEIVGSKTYSTHNYIQALQYFKSVGVKAIKQRDLFHYLKSCGEKIRSETVGQFLRSYVEKDLSLQPIKLYKVGKGQACFYVFDLNTKEYNIEDLKKITLTTTKPTKPKETPKEEEK